MMFLGIETLSLAAYVLAAYQRTATRSIEAGLKYFILGAVASAFVLMGIAFVYGATGLIDLGGLRSVAFTNLTHTDQVFLLFGSASLLIGLAFKISAVPFHWWAPDVYQGATLPVTMFFATAVKAGAFIALWRVVDALQLLPTSTLLALFWWLAVLTIALGNLAALRQDDMKRMLAYSSIAHAGYAVVALCITAGGDSAVITHLLFYLIGYSIMTIGAFTVLIILSGGDKEHTKLKDVTGLAKRNPGLAAIYSLFLLSLAGVPPTIGFFAKYYVFQAAVGTGLITLTIIGVLGSVISVAYYIRPIIEMYFRAESGEMRVVRPVYHICTRLVLWATVLGVLGWGLFPESLMKILS